jgi:16S rRNA (adenine1518-N6/adenine1519-N6)-dimethyltransferase
MAHILREELSGHERIEIAEANALTFDWAGAARAAGRPLIVVGNLPYQIASPLLFGLLGARAHLARMVVMLQLEMAERIVAAPDTPEYGALSVMVRIAATARIAFRLPPGAFHPPPRVHSAVLVVEPLAGHRAPITDEGWFHDVVHAAFGQRRKTLRNALSTMLEEAPIAAGLAAAGIDGQRRGETLSVEEFAALAEALLVAAGGHRREPSRGRAGRPRVPGGARDGGSGDDPRGA